jgi:hypothetical protein
MSELLELLEGAGFSSFRDARGPMGFNQRQGGGKFTGDEADMYIEQLQQEAEQRLADPDAAPAPRASPSKIVQRPMSKPASKVAQKVTNKPVSKVVRKPTPKRVTAQPFSDAPDLTSCSADDLAGELRSRGWTATPPP